MKLNQKILKNIIREVLEEQEADPQSKKATALKTAAMSTSAFGKAGREGRLAVDTELTSLERGIIQQFDEFLLKLAQLPGVDLNSQKMVIQRVMKMLQQQIGKSAKKQPAAEPQQGTQ
tara:strand:- start:602 stop:955 length:354 start_codon:yes stop_codon:yes gene_type:complete